jgi:hypothetical protein
MMPQLGGFGALIMLTVVKGYGVTVSMYQFTEHEKIVHCLYWALNGTRQSNV